MTAASGKVYRVDCRNLVIGPHGGRYCIMEDTGTWPRRSTFDSAASREHDLSVFLARALILQTDMKLWKKSAYSQG